MRKKTEAACIKKETDRARLEAKRAKEKKEKEIENQTPKLDQSGNSLYIKIFLYYI